MFCLYAEICPKTEIVGRNSLKIWPLAGENSLKSGIKANTLICAAAIKSARGTRGAEQKKAKHVCHESRPNKFLG